MSDTVVLKLPRNSALLIQVFLNTFLAEHGNYPDYSEDVELLKRPLEDLNFAMRDV